MRPHPEAALRSTALLLALWTSGAVPATGSAPCAKPYETSGGGSELVSLPVLLVDGVGLAAASLQALKASAVAVFEPIGVRLVWAKIEDVDRCWRLAEGLKAIVFHEVPHTWKVPEATLGTVIGEEPTRTVYLFHRAIRSHTVGPRPAWWSAAQEGRALGRILAHEIVHALAPHAPHAPAGLMAPRLHGSQLLATKLAIDDASAEAFRQGVLRRTGLGRSTVSESARQ